MGHEQHNGVADVLRDRSVVVYGGGGGWGKNIVEASTGISRRVSVVEHDATLAEVIAAAQNNDVLTLATPDPAINKILIEIRQSLTREKIILDCASNKSGFATTLKEIAEDGASVCSTHPMVMPKTSPRGQTVIIMPVGENAQIAKQVAERIYGQMGMRPEELDFDQHADMMVILQMVPHLMERILIHAMAHGLKKQNMSNKDVSRLAPANYRLAELGVGRVGIQRPDVSAGIIETALQTPFGKLVFGRIQETIGQIMAASDRAELSKLFMGDINLLDPDGSWREEMTNRTEAALTRLGNLRLRSCQITVPNKPAILRDVLSILHDLHDIDMTAIDSQIIQQGNNGDSVARFDIGISDEHVDFPALEKNLQKVGATIVLQGSPSRKQDPKS